MKRGKPIVFRYGTHPFTGGLCRGVEEALATMRTGGNSTVESFGLSCLHSPLVTHTCDPAVSCTANATLHCHPACLELVQLSHEWCSRLTGRELLQEESER